MNITFTAQGWEDYQYWLKYDKKVAKRIHELMKEIVRNPIHGIGKPEALKHNLSGCWSRRITEEHRIVYRPMGDSIIFMQFRYHYQ